MKVTFKVERHLIPLFITVLLIPIGCNKESTEIDLQLRSRIEKLFNDGKSDLACPIVDSLWKVFPEDARLNLQKGICLSHDKKYREALTSFDLAMSQSNNDSCALRQRIFEERGFLKRFDLLDNLGAQKDYLDAYHLAISCPPIELFDYFTNLNNYAYIAIDMKNFQVSDSVAEALISNFPDERDGYDLLAYSYSKSDRIQEAIAEYSTILAKFPNESKPFLRNIYLDRANLYQKINNLPAACADWQKAFELGTEEAKLKLDSFCTKTK
jgi:tetratricopeptide (TPR) repeat protein